MVKSLLGRIDKRLASISVRSCLVYALIGCLLLGYIDFLSGPELSFSVFYAAPIMYAAWYGGKQVGLALAIISATMWLTADLAAGVHYSAAYVPVWNTLVRLAFYLIILTLLLIVRDDLEREKNIAATDHLTGLANRRFFQDQLERETARLRRYPQPLTLAYIDLDNFKQVNDAMGHDVGDALLKKTASVMLASVRGSDLVARLGGDEFALLFPLLDMQSARVVLEKLSKELLGIMQKNAWPVTFSVGAVTFSEVMTSSNDMIKLVDALMYEVKKCGKNAIKHAVWPDVSTQ